jgi:hypothetical protein
MVDDASGEEEGISGTSSLALGARLRTVGGSAGFGGMRNMPILYSSLKVEKYAYVVAAAAGRRGVLGR